MIFTVLFLALLEPKNSNIAGTEINSNEHSALRFVQSSGNSEALVEFRGKLHKLSLHGSCGAGEGGGYNTWASNLDAESLPIPDAPRLHVFSSGTWSRIEFYLSTPPADVNLYHEGDDMVQFKDGVYSFSGPASSDTDETIRINFVCPSKSA